MSKITQTAFAAVDLRGSGKPWIMAWSIRGLAKDVRDEVGKAWCKEDPAMGWRAAKIEGIKVVKIDMTANQ
jgi:hypothetical protein